MKKDDERRKYSHDPTNLNGPLPESPAKIKGWFHIFKNNKQKTTLVSGDNYQNEGLEVLRRHCIARRLPATEKEWLIDLILSKLDKTKQDINTKKEILKTYTKTKLNAEWKVYNHSYASDKANLVREALRLYDRTGYTTENEAQSEMDSNEPDT